MSIGSASTDAKQVLGTELVEETNGCWRNVVIYDRFVYNMGTQETEQALNLLRVYHPELKNSFILVWLADGLTPRWLAFTGFPL